ncbi:MAG: hypothetical protein R3E62_02025 [Pseudomonadales bacterium]|jgi:hypothetical protein
MKLHQKGFLLVELNKVTECWDYELIDKALVEYNVKGARWVNTFRVALDELSAAGLTMITDKKLDDGSRVGIDKVLFRFRLTDFGRTRLQETGLLASTP